jgi:UDP-glucose 4-epimerase
MAKKIVLTGGAGYIGSHIFISLVEKGYEPIIIDNFTNSNEAVIQKIELITNKKINFYKCDVTNNMDELFKNENVFGVIHLAAYKSIPNSLSSPLEYFYNNVNGLISILQAMKNNQCDRIIFSSSCSIYNNNSNTPVTEECQIKGNNPYSLSKIMCEEILNQTAFSDPNFRYMSLRYFNPVGAHKSGLIGENVDSEESNLMNEICKVAIKKKKKLSIFGNDYNTHDGTCVRDFIHIDDLVLGHIAALESLSHLGKNMCINLGTGNGYSILDLVKTFEKVNDITIPFEFCERRKGDIEQIYANTKLAEKLLKWKSKKSLEDMCLSSWHRVKKTNS